MIESNLWIKNEVIRENREMVVYGFKHNKTDKFENYILKGPKADKKWKQSNILLLF